MAEKKSEKKLLALLLVLVALSLVVDILSLNVLYNLANSDAGFEGELATLKDCEDSCNYELTQCLEQHLTNCYEEHRRCYVDCDNQYSAYPPDYFWKEMWPYR